MRWDPSQYGRFAGPRLQPGLDLLMRLSGVIDPADVRFAVDLGCGTGELTELLAERFSSARTIGFDSSEEMLRKATAQAKRASFELADIASWSSPEPVDVLFSNAAYQWLPDHEALFPRLLGCVREGGVFAAQMPRNFAAASHRLMREVAALPRFNGRVVFREEPVYPPERYYDLLAPLTSQLELWETEYLHVLEGEDPVFEWTKGTGLLPVFAALSGPDLDAFIAEYKERLRAAYPRRSDGKTLFPFRRIFLLAKK